MQNSKHIIIRAALAVWLALPVAAQAQSSSLNAFSPYTFYGLGDFSTQGPAYMRSMGGVGVGYRNSMKINYINPASYSLLGRKTFLFNVGIEGNNTYSKTAEAKTSHNSFNVRDIALAMPLGRGVGLGVSVTPLSSVGYRVQMEDTDPLLLANDKYVVYNYLGEGTVTQAKLGLGVQVTKHLALGADLIYYHGRTTRSFSTTVTSLMTSTQYSNAVGRSSETISRIGMNFGPQYDILRNDKRILTFGATYRPKLNLKPENERIVYTSGIESDTVSYSNRKQSFNLPGMLRAGLFYQTHKLGVGFDYSMEQWNGINPPDSQDDVVFKNNQYYRVGVEYTPNAIDIRRFLNRWTYRFGVYYNDYYMRINGHKINDVGLSVGVGIPIKMQGFSSVNLGLTWGCRGTTATGMIGTRQFRMVRENYIKVSIGLSLFGEDDWFKRFKYQ